MKIERPTHFIDFEASGIAPDSYPIEVAVVFPGGEYQALIKPASYWDHWSYDAQDMHQITREQLVNEGSPAIQVAERMNELFDGKILCSDNPADCYWLDVLYEAAGIEATFEVKPIESFVGREAASEILRRVPVRKGHRALLDAHALQLAVQNCSNELPS
ncbi:3'-5' exonuclease [Pseudomonas sp. TH31]|uniref:3'-5' exonuclease n=1 Tax=Pseudomonas sp. TH31 TaxID=2796396 RepID=UPI001913B273|nr:hypothetical protein [Pseudomonas sp. TH31]MBK5417724.1 hypothetical protein [Pseudomonas sp. TH31]